LINLMTLEAWPWQWASSWTMPRGDENITATGHEEADPRGHPRWRAQMPCRRSCPTLCYCIVFVPVLSCPAGPASLFFRSLGGGVRDAGFYLLSRN